MGKRETIGGPRWNFKSLFSNMSRVYLFGEYYLQNFTANQKRGKMAKNIKVNKVIKLKLFK
uniref:Uncharacterized protein n=1 Tax=Meloidogyne incognita TaxID=6306 RepID=A0A914NFB7_MELIC